MDNSTDPNSPSNLPPSDPGTNPQTNLPPWQNNPAPQNPVNSNPWAPLDTSTSPVSINPLNSSPAFPSTPTPQPDLNQWAPAATPDPNPWAPPAPTQPTWTPPQPQTPSFDINSFSPAPQSNLPPTPQYEQPAPPPPTFITPSPEISSFITPPVTPQTPNWMPSAPVQPTENAPTDLSHLISNNSGETISQPSETPETLVVPQGNTMAPDVPNLPFESHKGIPKWLIVIGTILFVIVAGASAYFILGIGQPPKTTTSLPAVTQTTTVKPPAPIPTQVPQPTEAPAATGSANFGELQGSTNTSQATSAAELIRQRNQASPAPSPVL